MSGNYDVGVLPMSELRHRTRCLCSLGWVCWRSCWLQFGRGNSLQTDCSVYICHAQHVAHHNHLAAAGGRGGGGRRRCGGGGGAARRQALRGGRRCGGGGSRLVVVLKAKSRPFRRRRRGVPRGDHRAYLPVRRVFVFFLALAGRNLA